MAGVLVDRRDFLKAAGLAFIASLSPAMAHALSNSDAVFATGFRDPSGGYGLATLTEQGQLVSASVLPDRAHGLAHNPLNGDIVAFARRPGTFFAAFRRSGEPLVVHARADRHFFGHGCFSRDGKRLFASENDFGAQQGVIGVYDASDHYRRIGEFAAHGIGTHDLALSHDGTMLVAANGGIATHPDFGRTKLNLDTMQPSVALIDAGHGQLVEHRPLTGALAQLSTRHADPSADGSVWIACQSEGPASDRPPVIGQLRLGEAMRWITLPDEAAAAMANYVGAIAVNDKAGLVAATSPRGGAYVILDMASGKLVRLGRLEGTSALAADRGGFVFSSETGVFGSSRSDLAFDQHMVRIGPAA